MATTKVVQNSLVSGVFNETAFGRTDIAKFYSSVAEADNMIVKTTGGMFKRPGFEFIHKTNATKTEYDTKNKSIRLIDFVFNTDQKYLFLFRPGKVDVYYIPLREDSTDPTGGPIATINTPELTATIITEMSVIQRGDVTILLHGDLQPKEIARTGFDTFTYSNLALTSPRESDGTTNVWSAAKGWPKYGTFYQGRLFIAGSKSYPLTIWGSKSQSYFDFYIDVAQADADGSPIADTIDSDKINVITGIFAGRNLQVFTTGAEFVNSTALITPINSSWQIQTRYGSSPNVPLDSLDGSTFYIDRTGAVREFIYDYNQDSHISNDLTTLASQLFNNPFRINIIKSSENNLGRFTYTLNSDGSLAVLNFNRTEGIVAWVKFTTPTGKIIDISAVDNELYILILSTKGEINLERLDLSDKTTFLDSHVYSYAPYPVETYSNGTTLCSNTVGGEYGDEYLLNGIWCDNCIMFYDTNTPFPQTITGLDRFEGQEVSVLMDGIYQGEFTVNGGQISTTRFYRLIEIGAKYKSHIKTLPIASADAPIDLNNKRIIKVKLYLFNSTGFYLDGAFIASNYFDIDNFDKAATARTGVYEYWTLGWNTLSSFKLSNDDPYGFNLLKFETYIDVSK
jgi:hypothetical protein